MGSARQWEHGSCALSPQLLWVVSSPALWGGPAFHFLLSEWYSALSQWIGQQTCEEGKSCPCSSALNASLGCSCHPPVCLISSQLRCLPFTGTGFLVQQAHFLVIGIVKPLHIKQSDYMARKRQKCWDWCLALASSSLTQGVMQVEGDQKLSTSWCWVRPWGLKQKWLLKWETVSWSKFTGWNKDTCISVSFNLLLLAEVLILHCRVQTLILSLALILFHDEIKSFLIWVTGACWLW